MIIMKTLKIIQMKSAKMDKEAEGEEIEIVLTMMNIAINMTCIVQVADTVKQMIMKMTDMI